MEFPNSFTIITDEVSQDLSDLVRFAREFQLPGIELRSISGRAFMDLTPADIAEVRNTADGEGWRIYGCATPVFKCALDDDSAIAEHLEIFRRSIDTAHSLDCDFVRVFTFLRREGKNRTWLPRVAEHMQSLREIAAGSQIRIGVENEHSTIVATGPELADLFALLPESQFGIVWDPCNILYLKEISEDITEQYSMVSPRVIHIHVKDCTRRSVSSEAVAAAMPIGLGEVGWRDHMPAIVQSGYKGMLSLETHWRVQAISEEMLHLPGGYGFSQGGEEATRTCLNNLRALLPAKG